MAYKEKSDSELMSGQACWMRENKYFQQCKEQKLLKIYNVRKKNQLLKNWCPSLSLLQCVPGLSQAQCGSDHLSSWQQLLYMPWGYTDWQCLGSALPFPVRRGSWLLWWEELKGQGLLCFRILWDEVCQVYKILAFTMSFLQWEVSETPGKRKKKIHSGEIDKITN